jgi:hypothetical protein
MAFQTSISNTIAAAFAGMLADNSDNDIISRTSSEVSAEMPFGVCLAKGATDGTALLPATIDDELIGVLLHSHAYEPDSATSPGDLGTTGVKPKAGLNLLWRGRMWVTVEQAVNQYDPCFVRFVANGAGKLQPGAFRKDSDGGTAINCQAVAKFVTSQATIGGLAMIQVDFTNG